MKTYTARKTICGGLFGYHVQIEEEGQMTKTKFIPLGEQMRGEELVGFLEVEFARLNMTSEEYFGGNFNLTAEGIRDSARENHNPIIPGS